MNENLGLIEISGRVGMSCALVAALAAGIFMVIGFIGGVG